ncbi:MAG: sulfotransferase family protein [Pseudomonadota bacterium]
MHPIVALWAVPRSTSTAFEWMMRQRGDMTCFHEPFGEAWYQGEAPLWPRATPDSLRTPGLTLASVEAALRAAAEERPVFTKDFPHYVDHYWDEAFLNLFTHSFLIRDPAKTITSIHDKWPDFHEKEVGFAEQRQLFDLISVRDGKAPPVIDSDDLLENPAAVVEAWCRAVGIPFLPAALSWAPGARDEVSWWDGGSFHANLRNSDGLKPQPRRYVDIAETPDRVQEVHARCLPHYDHLYAHRLRPAVEPA